MKSVLFVFILLSFAQYEGISATNYASDPDSALAAQPKAELYQKYKVNGNSHSGTLEFRFIDSYRIEGTIYGVNINGYCQGRNIVFHRNDSNQQIWQGWLSSDKNMIAGSFSHKGEGNFPFYAIKQ